MPPHKKFPNKKHSALGRGLDALISTDDINPQGSSSINEIEINRIVANPNQPRREMDQESLQELADSITQIGIVQPITLRQMEDGTYQIIAGERRWRASQLAGLTTIPAYVRKASDESVARIADGRVTACREGAAVITARLTLEGITREDTVGIAVRGV